jgi:hypothetical protein
MTLIRRPGPRNCVTPSTCSLAVDEHILMLLFHRATEVAAHRTLYHPSLNIIHGGPDDILTVLKLVRGGRANERLPRYVQGHILRGGGEMKQTECLGCGCEDKGDSEPAKKN